MADETKINPEFSPLDCAKAARALGGGISASTIHGVKLASEACRLGLCKEKTCCGPCFSGRYTRLVKLSHWLDCHPNFSATREKLRRKAEIERERQDRIAA